MTTRGTDIGVVWHGDLADGKNPDSYAGNTGIDAVCKFTKYARYELRSGTILLSFSTE